MSPKRKKPSGDRRRQKPDVTITVPGAKVPSYPYPPGQHPGGDIITVIYPKKPSDEAFAQLRGDFADDDFSTFASNHMSEVLSEDVTRDEFTRRLAGNDVVRQVNADPLNRVVMLANAEAVAQWWETTSKQ